MSKKPDKNPFGGDIVNRFSLLTNEGKKKLNEESKKSAKLNNPKKSDTTQLPKKKKKDIVVVCNDDIIISEKPANGESLFNFDFENKNQKKIIDFEEQDNVIDRDENEGKNNYLNSQWTVWVHRNDCEDWSISSYQNIFLIDSIASFWEFFNHFYLMNKEDNQYFIMRNKIKPKWEDNNNRNGGICSLKMDCYDRNSKFDVGTEIMVTLCVLIMNETFIQENTEINGISFSVKSRSVYIKIWTKEYKNDIKDKLPKNLMNKFNSVVKNHVYRKFENNISVRYTQIEPEHDEEV